MTKLLIIEDQPEEAANMARLMGGLLQVETQTTPSLALSKAILRAWKPDVVLLDLGLSDSGPAQTVEAITDMSKERPIVVVTSQRGIEADNIRKQAMRNGARNFVQKDHIGIGGWQMLAGIIRDAFLQEWAKSRTKTQPLRT